MQPELAQLQAEMAQQRREMARITRRRPWWLAVVAMSVMLGPSALLMPLRAVGAPAPAAVLTNEELTIKVKRQAKRVKELETLLEHFSRVGTDVYLTGANLHILSGSGATGGAVNGLGNLIVGYNESRGAGDDRSGSHNIVVGPRHNYSSYGGLIAGFQNTISGTYAVVSGGNLNTASGNRASVSGGEFNTASGLLSSVSGGRTNTASGLASSVSGGRSNTASGFFASVSGGTQNLASGSRASVSGGLNRTASGIYDWRAGTLFQTQ